MASREGELPFRIELWDDGHCHVEEVIALASDFSTASCASEEAVKRRPGLLITLGKRLG